MNTIVFAQQENVWAFGNKAGFDFNGGTPVAILDTLDALEGCASVCSNTGRLLFYTDGNLVYDSTNHLMPHGGLGGAFIYLNGLNASSTTQGALIVPMPDSINKYYLFSLTQAGDGEYDSYLFYSVIDMTLNGGLGDVVVNQRAILIDMNLTEKMTAVIGNNCDVWVIVHSLDSALFKSYEVTSSGINPIPVRSYTGTLTGLAYQAGVLKISPNREKAVTANTNAFGNETGGLEIYDFDPATGIFSNAIRLDTIIYYGAAFSPNSSVLYTNGYYGNDTEGVYQYDLSSNDPVTIKNSKTLLYYHYWSDMKLGPDGKIYEPGGGYGDAGYVINNPDQLGAACQYMPNPVQLLPSTSYQQGLPNSVPVLVAKDTSRSRQYLRACFKDSLTITPQPVGWNYKWDNGSSSNQRTVGSSGIFAVQYMGPACTYYFDTFVVTIIPPLLAGSLGGCPGQHNGKAWVQPGQGDATTYTYTWTDAFGDILQPATTSSVIADTLYNQVAGTYIVSLHGLDGCDTSLSVTIALPSDSGFLHASDTGMCPHDTITIHATGGASYQWQPDSRTYISDASIADPRVSPSTDWSYLVYGANTSGCLDTATTHVRVFPDPVIQLPDSVILYYGESYQFSPGTNCLSFSWFPPLGLSANNISNPIAFPPVDTKYIVTGSTEEGCMVKDSVNVYRINDVILMLPNAFTPGNGPDNLFKPIYKGDVILDYLRIFNRWGQLVYESSDVNQGWDGTWHGLSQPEGVYVYMMEGYTATGKIISKQGNVTLLR